MRTAITAISVLILGACNQANGEEAKATGKGAERSYQVGDFQRVSLAGSHDVVVTVGDAASVRAVGDAEALDRLEIRVDNGELILRDRKRDGLFWGSNKHKATIYVTAPALAAAAVAGSGDMKIDRVQGDSFKAAVAGSGDIEIAQIQVDEAKFSIAGSGDIKAAGTAQRTKASIAGSGDIDIGGVQVRTASVSIAGSGDVRIHASETANVSIVGSGNVEVGGTARCNVSKRGSGEVRCAA